MDRLLCNNQGLAQRMSANLLLQDPETSTIYTAPAAENLAQAGEGASQVSIPNSRLPVYELPFERDLKESRVYRRAKRDTMDGSVRSSVGRTHTWSVFSGLSLSNISDISVIALPIYAEDLTNPHHYNFGSFQVSRIPNAGLRSIYHECLDIQNQLLQIQNGAAFANDISRARERQGGDVDPLSLLIDMFREGDPLLRLLNCVDGSHQAMWEGSPELTAAEFSLWLACNLGMDRISLEDLEGDDTNKHLKVRPLNLFIMAEKYVTDPIRQLIRFVDQLLSTLTTRSEIPSIQPSYYEPLSAQTPMRAVFEELLKDERTYVRHVESIVELADVLKSRGILLVGHQRPAAEAFNSATVLADAHRRLLIKLETLALGADWDAQLYNPFIRWRVFCIDAYPKFVAAEKGAKEALRCLLGRDQSASNLVVLPESVQLTLVNALNAFSLVAQRASAYQDFLEVGSHQQLCAHADMTAPGACEYGSKLATVSASC